MRMGWAAGWTAAAVAWAGTAQAEDDAAAFRDAFLAGEVEWADVEARAAAEGAVRFHHWGGSTLLNVWLDDVVEAAMARRGIELDAVRLTATADAVDLVLAERAAGNGPGDGAVDVIWVNGENFATLKDQGALFGSFAPLLPEAANVDFSDDPRALPNLRDFGTATDGAEIPWSSEEYVCAVDRARVEDEPNTPAELRAWLEAEPGRFSYVAPPHYLGNTFVQSIVYALNPDGTGAEPFQADVADVTAEELARLVAPGLDYLRDLEPLLLGGPEAARYFADEAAQDAAFASGEVAMACKFGLYATATGMLTGAVPDAAEQIVFPEGAMIRNKSYLVIPSNAPNPAAALVFADWMTSVEAQASKLTGTGFPAGIDAWMLDEADADALAEASPGLIGITQEVLDANAAPDTNASLVGVIEAAWIAHVQQGDDRGVDAIVAEAHAAALSDR